jgi:hypothetical protein
MSDVSTFYQIEDGTGAIIETGYQEKTIYNEEASLTIALSSEIKNIKVKMYDPDIEN